MQFFRFFEFFKFFLYSKYLSQVEATKFILFCVFRKCEFYLRAWLLFFVSSLKILLSWMVFLVVCLCDMSVTFFLVLHSLIIVPPLSIPPETITLPAIFEVIALHSNWLGTVESVPIIHSCLVCHNGWSKGEKVLWF